MPVGAVGDDEGGAHLLTGPHEGVVVRLAVREDPVPREPLGLPPPAAHPVERAREVVGEAQQELLGRPDAVAGEREDRVLLRVGGHDVRVVAGEVRRGEVAAKLRGDVEVVDLVPGGVAGDLDDAHLGLAVLVGAEDDGGLGHGSAPSIGRIGERAQQ